MGVDELRRQNPVITVGLDAATDDLLRLAVVIDVRSVDEVDALLARLVNERKATSSGVWLPNNIAPSVRGDTLRALRPSNDTLHILSPGFQFRVSAK